MILNTLKNVAEWFLFDGEVSPGVIHKKDFDQKKLEILKKFSSYTVHEPTLIGHRLGNYKKYPKNIKNIMVSLDKERKLATLMSLMEELMDEVEED